MISLLRRIRQSLIESLPAREGTAEQAGGSARKYMLYAIGEIALVVIGILIALQINNWNQTNSNNKIASDYLVNLEEELKSDLQYYQQLKGRHNKQKEYVDETIINMNSYDLATEELDMFISRMSEGMNPTDFFPKSATYQDLVSSGKMALIKPAALRQKIISHYNLMNQKSLHFNRELDYSWGHVIPLFNDRGLYEWRNHPLTALNPSILPKRTEATILNLDKSSSEFETIETNLFFVKLMLTVRNENLDELIESTNKLIEEINL